MFDHFVGLALKGLKLECRSSANISAFSLLTLVSTSVSGNALDVLKLKIYFSISSLHTSENEKETVDLSFYTSPVVSMLA